MNSAAATERKRAPKTTQMERTKTLVLDSTIALLSEVPFRRLTVDLVSERSGVSRSTIYRYWKTVPDLVSDAFDRAIGPEPELNMQGTIREQLMDLYGLAPDSLGESTWGKILPALVAASSGDGEFSGRLQELARRRRGRIVLHMQNWIADGSIKPDTNLDWVIDTLSGIFYLRHLITGGSLREEGMRAWVVDTVLESICTDEYKAKMAANKS